MQRTGCRSVSRYAPWSCDESDRLVLLKVPEQIDLDRNNAYKRIPPSLSTLDKPNLQPRPAPFLDTLPSELHYTIIQHLIPVDRVCLALTCRRLCASVLAAPRLTLEEWCRFTPLSASTGRYYNTHSHFTTYLIPGPEFHQLPLRLAHGWVDKKTWRYCWKCHKILPREEKWWWTRDADGNKRLQGRRNPRWNAKTGVTEEEWNTWGKKKKLKWMVDVWCNAGWEDSSVIGCQWCRQKMTEEGSSGSINFGVSEQKLAAEIGITGAPEILHRLDLKFVGTRHPVHCPGCLERELTFVWVPPTRVRAWRAVKRTVGRFCDWYCFPFWCLDALWLAVTTIMWPLVSWIIYHLRETRNLWRRPR